MLGATGEVNAAAADLDEEEHLELVNQTVSTTKSTARSWSAC
jgi:hypothetical protein